MLRHGPIGRGTDDGRAFGEAAADKQDRYLNEDGGDVMDDGKNLQHEYKRMAHQGRQFLCEIPVVSTKSQAHNDDKVSNIGAGIIDGGESAEKADAVKSDGEDDSTKSANGENEDSSDAMALQAAKVAEQEQQQRNELARAAHHGSKLLRGMRGTCTYFPDGWWTYSFCYGDRIRQFHQLAPSQNIPVYPPQEDPTTTTFDLGVFINERKGSDAGSKDRDSWEVVERGSQMSPRGDALRLETQGEARYLVQTLTGGTICDLTGRNRKIEVQVCISFSSFFVTWLRRIKKRKRKFCTNTH